MGTNFYWHTDPQHGEACEALHIGKRSGAGGGYVSWSLQGHRETDFGPLDSWAKWKQVMRAVPTSDVFDEYDQPYTPEGFITLVETTMPMHRRRQYDWMAEHGYPVLPEGIEPPLDYTGDWLCAAGFSFSYTTFS